MREAEAVGARNANETYLIERMRIAAASGAGDVDTAARSFEALSASGRLSRADKLRMIESIAGTYYRAQQYAQGDAVEPALLQGRRHQPGDPHDADPEPVPERRLRRRGQGADGRDPGRRARRHAAGRGSPQAAAERGDEAGRQQRLRLRDGKAGHLLPEEGVLGRPAEPDAAQGQLLRPARARRLSTLARDRQHDRAGRLHGDGAARPAGRPGRAKASR